MRTSSVESPIASDLDAVLQRTDVIWDDFRGETLFITGGTGFVGCWLLESFLWANTQLNLGAKAIVLTRNPASFSERAPHLASHESVELVEGDVRSFDLPPRHCRYVIHAAAETRGDLQGDALEVGLEGTRRVLGWASENGTEKVLLTGSGAVYPDAAGVMEEAYPSPLPAPSLYGAGKRLAEDTCLDWSARTGIEMKVARCFSFIGPYLPLEGSFAAGNFIADALRGGPVRAQGNRASYRSYMYAADLATWLWVIFARGESRRPYNVGSSHRLTTADLAKEVAQVAGVDVRFYDGEAAQASLAPNEYVPNTDRARSELSLIETVDLRESIRRTLSWFQPHPSHPGRTL